MDNLFQLLLQLAATFLRLLIRGCLLFRGDACLFQLPPQIRFHKFAFRYLFLRFCLGLFQLSPALVQLVP